LSGHLSQNDSCESSATIVQVRQAAQMDQLIPRD
jgi:hypothetical protein